MPIYRDAVGEINVVAKMEEVSAVVGGEGNGGVILPDVHLGPRRGDGRGARSVRHRDVRGGRPCQNSSRGSRRYYSVKMKLRLDSAHA